MDSTRLVSLAVSRGLLPPDRAPEAANLTPDQMVDQGLIERREMDMLLRLSGEPRVLFDRYEIVDEVGRGGMGIVYRCRDTKLDRVVAVKCMPLSLDGDEERFEREARTAARLKHPNIVAVHDFGRMGRDVYLTMDYIDGKSLDKLLEAGVVDRRQGVAVIRQVAEALAYAHRHDVIHRDVKPENILVDGKGRAFLTDFGLAKRVERDVSITVSGMVLGTPSYMSPEQAAGKPVDRRSDVYNLGATLYYALTGTLPHTGESPMAVVLDVITNDPTPPRKINATVPADLETICLKAMEREPEQRYAGVREFGDDLDRYLRGEAIEARPPGTLYLIGKKMAKHRAAVSVAVVGLLALVVTAGVLGSQSWARKQALERQRQFELDQARARAAARPYLEAGREVLRDLDRALIVGNVTPPERDAFTARARQWFDRALERHPNHPEALLEIARSYEMEHRLDTAVDYFGRAIAAEPRFGTAHLERARLRLELYEKLRHGVTGKVQGETDQSRVLSRQIQEDLLQVTAWSLDESEKLYAQGMLAFAEGQWAEAGEALQRYAEHRRSDPRAWDWAGHAWYHAIRNVEAIRCSSEAMKLRPNDPMHWQMRGLARKDAGDLKGALADYDRAIELEPHNEHLYVNRAIVRLKLNDPDGALADSQKALDLVPNYAAAYFERGGAWRAKGEFARAYDDYTHCLKLDPDYAHAYVNRGLTLELMERPAEALADFEKATSLNPRLAEGYLSRANTYARRKDYDRALAELETLLKVAPRHAAAFATRGKILRERGDRAGAMRDLEQALKLDPKDVLALNTRGLIALDEERLDEAMADFAKCLEVDPTHVPSINNRGLTHHRMGNLDEALKDYLRTVELDPRYETGWYNAANIYKLQQKWAPAAEHFRKALAVAPADWDMREKAQQRLKDVEERLKRASEF